MYYVYDMNMYMCMNMMYSIFIFTYYHHHIVHNRVV